VKRIVYSKHLVLIALALAATLFAVARITGSRSELLQMSPALVIGIWLFIICQINPRRRG